jgi:hypothetical protein
MHSIDDKVVEWTRFDDKKDVKDREEGREKGDVEMSYLYGWLC